ncbi:hypothetical protein BGZ70_003986 [Mortierella alpina]|uniref:Uncharacterized protein n=1 Tax=Mortierella alpina TaxID=64518 RepID=A0A9P6JAF5_MORAP|nr:hypothetical protein BGZ70_003986 [Mortierella alpina]
MTIQRLALQAMALVKEARTILKQLLQDYKNAQSRQDGVEKQYEVYYDRLGFVVPMGLDEPPADHAKTSELPRKNVH